MRKRTGKILIISLISGITIFSFSCNSGTTPAEEEQVVITPVTVTSVSYKPLEEKIGLPAVSTFMNRYIVRSSTTGTIISTNVSQGDYVSKNLVLFTLKTREAAVISAGLKNDSSFSFKGEIKIASSGEGVITSLSHQNGDFVQEGDELAVISDQSSFVFILEVPFELSSFVEKTHLCKILLPGNKVVSGTITGRLPEMDPQSQTVKYIIRPAGAGHLPANLVAQVNIVKNSSVNAAVLPKSAILGNETQTEFWIMKLIDDSTAVKVQIKKGIEINDEVEIAEPALSKSDRILITGGYGLPDTARVTIKQ